MLRNLWLFPAVMSAAFVFTLFFAKRLRVPAHVAGLLAVFGCLVMSVTAGVQWYNEDEIAVATAEHIEQAARALKSISHPLRLKILCVVGDQEACVQEIVDAVGTSQSNISQHLAILREKGVLLTRKDANRVYYRVGDARTLQLIGMMREVFCS